MASFRVKSLMLHVLPEEATNNLLENEGFVAAYQGCTCSCTCSCVSCSACSCFSCSCTCSQGPNRPASRFADFSDHKEKSAEYSELAVLKNQLKYALAQTSLRL